MKSLQNRVKVLMNYDSSKTLTENYKIILESNVEDYTLSEVSKNLRYWLTGDVQSADLGKIHNELKTKIFGNTSEDGGCALKKLITYFEKDTKGVGFQDFFGTTAGLTLGLSDFFKSSNFVKQIQDSSEAHEGSFNDVKRKLLSDINTELNGFCKTQTNSLVSNNGQQSTGGRTLGPDDY